MALTCGFQTTFGKCEPAVLLDDLKSAVLDLVDNYVRAECTYAAGGVCDGEGSQHDRIAGFIRHPEAGWLPVCARHLGADEDDDRTLVLRKWRR